jgi:phospholipid transport system substrate-binding protein
MSRRVLNSSADIMRRHSSLPSFLLVAALFSPGSLHAGEAMDAVKGTVDQVLATLKSSDPAAGKLSPQTRERLNKIVSERFDFGEMAKRSLGPYWARQSPEKQQEFVKAFTDLLVNSYSDTIASYRGEKINYLDESYEDGAARVKTTVANSRGENFAVSYRLHRSGADWKVYDVIIEDVSLVSNYRSQFTRTLNNKSIDELLRVMQNRAVSAPGARSSGPG